MEFYLTASLNAKSFTYDKHSPAPKVKAQLPFVVIPCFVFCNEP